MKEGLDLKNNLKRENNLDHKDDYFFNSEKDIILNKLKKLLEDKSPIKFNPRWIELNKDNPELYNNIRLNFRDKNKKVDWNIVISMLDKKWQERWGIQEQRKSVSLEDISNEIISVFKEKKPDKISPSWLTNNIKNSYRVLKKKLPRENNRINYQPLLDLLPKDIVSKWSIEEHRKDISLEDISNDIIRIFKEEKPENISPSWISFKLKNDYDLLKEKFLPRENNRINYQPLLDLLPKDIVSKWSIEEHRKDISLEDISNDIIRIFKEEKPENISPLWLTNNIKNNYKILKKFLPRENNRINYQPLLDLLPKDIVERWKTSYLEDLIPKNSYNDSAETDIVINKNRDNMHLFLENIDFTKENQDIENIIIEMRGLIMKGNTDALDRLTDYLTFTVESWIEDPKKPDMKVWQYAQDILKNVIKNCIYRFDQNKGSFIAYLYLTLKKRSMDIKIDLSGGNNRKRVFVDDNIEYHDPEEYSDFY